MRNGTSLRPGGSGRPFSVGAVTLQSEPPVFRVKTRLPINPAKFGTEKESGMVVSWDGGFLQVLI